MKTWHLDQNHTRFSYHDTRWHIGEHDLHCGDCFQILIACTWVDTRIELSHDRWVLLIGSYWEPAANYDDYPVREY